MNKKRPLHLQIPSGCGNMHKMPDKVFMMFHTYLRSYWQLTTVGGE